MSYIRQVTSYDRDDHGAGVVSWKYSFWNPQPVENSGMATGIEFGLQLTGEWNHNGHVYRPGEIYRINSGELYHTSFCGRADRGLQVGFIFYPQDSAGSVDDLYDLVLPGDAGRNDRQLNEFSKWYAHTTNRSSVAEECRTVVKSYVQRFASQEVQDPLRRAKSLLDNTFCQQISVAEIAERSGLALTAFTRRFKKRFGCVPANYRLRTRLNHAARLSWSRLDMSIEEIALQSGFEDLPYFYRTFHAYFGTSPGKYGRRN